MGNREWYIVIKYTHEDYVGVRVDAHYVVTSDEAKALVGKGPMRPGEMLRGFWAKDQMDREAAVELHDNRMLDNRDWMVFVDRMEAAWQKVEAK